MALTRLPGAWLIDGGRSLSEFEGSLASSSACAEDGAFQVTNRVLRFDGNVYCDFLDGTLDLEGAEVEITVTVTSEEVSATTTRTVVLSFAGTA